MLYPVEKFHHYIIKRFCSIWGARSSCVTINKKKVYAIYFIVQKICQNLSTAKVKVDFGFFVEWHINICGLFNAKSVLIEEQRWYYLTHYQGDKGFNTFPKGISPKVNVTAWWISNSLISRVQFSTLAHMQLSS